MLYQTLKKCVGIFFNTLNLLMAGNLPPFVCACVVVEEQNRYLVVEQTDGSFVFPAGFMRWREHPMQAAQREGKEETGLQLRIGNIINYYSLASQQFDQMSVISIIYSGEVIGGELRSSIEGRPCWVHEDDLRGRMTPLFESILDDYLRHRT